MALSGEPLIVIDCGTISALPVMVSDSRIKAGHVVAGYDASNKYAIAGDWTVTTADGSLTITGGVIAAPVSLKIYLGGQYQISIGEAEHGTATPSAEYAVMGERVVLTPVPDERYRILRWESYPEVEFIDNTFIMPDCDITIIPVFEQYKFDIIIGESEHGTAEASAEYAAVGKTITLTSLPDERWRFLRWESDPVVTFTDDTFVMPDSDITITPVFERYVFDVQISGGDEGTATASPEYGEAGATILLTPVPGERYRFVRWESDPVVTFTDDTFAMPASDITITPVFEKYIFDVFVTESDEGSALATPSYATPGEIIRLVPTPGDRYLFSNWESDPTVEIDENNEFLMPNSDITITPIFELYKFDINIIGGDQGTAIASPEYAAEGETVTLTPVPDGRYRLTGWESDPVVEFTGNTFIMPGTAITITPLFERYKFDIFIDSSSQGTATANPPYAEAGETITLTPVPDGRYRFLRWESDPEVTIINNSFAMPNSDITITPIFERYKFDIFIGDSEHGTAVSYPIFAEYGERITLTPVPDERYRILRWESNPSVTIVNNTFTMPNSDITITPIFEKYIFDVHIGSSEHGSASPSSQSAEIGERIELTINPDSRYRLLRIDSDPHVEIDEDNGFIMPASDITVTPVFEKYIFDIRIRVSEHGSAEPSAYIAEIGETITLTIMPDERYRLYGWETSPEIGIDEDNEFIMPASDVIILPIFEQYIFDVIIGDSIHGRAEANVGFAEIGEIVELTYYPDERYRFLRWETSPEVAIDVNNEFIMPASNITITPVFEQYIFDVYIGNSYHGRAEASVSFAEIGETVSLTNYPDRLYRFLRWESIPAVTIDENNKFVMPASDITVTPVFEQYMFNIVIGDSKHGSVMASKDAAEAGETITLTILPESGYWFYHWDSYPHVDITNNTFIMPNMDAHITPVFTEAAYLCRRAREIASIALGRDMREPIVDYCEAACESQDRAINRIKARNDERIHSASIIEDPDENDNYTLVFNKAGTQ